jgi:hypothetical protein
VNPADWSLRGGRLRPFVRLKLPFVSGSDVASVIEAVGAAMTKFVPGEAVYAMTPTTTGGAYAEYVTVAADNVARVPSGLSLEEAAAAALVALTALQALRDKAKLMAGDHVLINSASGGVGSFAVQISKAMGARVTAMCSEHNIEFVRGLGADEIIATPAATSPRQGHATALCSARSTPSLSCAGVEPCARGAGSSRSTPVRKRCDRTAGTRHRSRGSGRGSRTAERRRPRGRGVVDLRRKGEAGYRPDLPALRRCCGAPLQREPSRARQARPHRR